MNDRKLSTPLYRRSSLSSASTSLRTNIGILLRTPRSVPQGEEKDACCGRPPLQC